MAKVTQVIKNALKEKDRAIISGSESMLRILEDLHGQVQAALGKAALGTWDAYHLRQYLDQIEYQIANYAAESKTRFSGLLDTAWAAGKTVVDAPLAVNGIYTGFHLSATVLDTLKEYSNGYLENLYQDAWYKIKGELTLGIVGNKTPQEVARAIGETIDKGRFANIAARAETIAQTEMGRVFSEATQLRMEQVAENVPGIEKQWIHAGHPKQARPTHVAANGQHVPVNEPFMIGGIPMMFPRDPAAPIAETINCGCDHIPYHESW
ncbi:MAG: hypothetical protein PHT59_07535 [Candidatus Omnitrophica bacterium]|nr:hypothetical protein [Candidatus Omnitrophota bacterium]